VARQATKQKSRRRHISKDNAKNFVKGFFGGVGGGEVAGSLMDVAGELPPIISVPARSAVAGGVGYWVGGKSMAGLVGGIGGELLTAGIQYMTGRSGGQGRLGGL